VKITNVLSVTLVSDFEHAKGWYERLFDRPPDHEPMKGSAVWQLAPGGGLQLNRDSDHAGDGTAVIGVDDVDAFVKSCADRGFALKVETEPTKTFRLAPITDPDGNTLVFAQDVADVGVNQPDRAG
jgi:predicted enzyme related to lactoylglutathione lyase